MRVDDVVHQAARDRFRRRIGRAAEDRVLEILRRRRAPHDLHRRGGKRNADQELGYPDPPASRAMMRLSAAQASTQPPATAWPLIAATTGLGWEKTVASMVPRAGRNSRI